jgi:ADP-heptose:LPS heptosyltransferase
MGDLIMSSPAIRALQESFHCRITLLTSTMASGIVPFLTGIDELIQFDAPWVKLNGNEPADDLFELVKKISAQAFDAAVIFTVFSQNPLPSAMIAYLAGIPRRLAYCRENPYELLSDWIPDKEPYSHLQHQVERDLALVAAIGARTGDKRLKLQFADAVWINVRKKLSDAGLGLDQPWLILHAGVSEEKRRYPLALWTEAGKEIVNELHCQLILTGNAAEGAYIQQLKAGIGQNTINAAGLLSLEEFIVLVSHAALIISVNTSAVHIAAATGTPMVVLYALSNPQHTPWMARGKLLPFEIPPELQSRNEVLRYVQAHHHPKNIPMVMAADILKAAREVLAGDGNGWIGGVLVPLQVS